MSAPTHLTQEQLLAYWFHESSPAETEQADEHLMRCGHCGERLDALVALGAGVREALLAGKVAVVASGPFLEKLKGQGLAVREYRLPPEGSVNCSVAPGDELLVSRLEAPLQGVERIDAIAETTLQPGAAFRLEDLPFDPSAGELLWVERIDRIRRHPEHTAVVTLVAPGPGGDRPLGRYTFRHAAWEMPEG